MRAIKRLEHLSSEGRLRELGLFGLEKRGPRKILSVYINSLWGSKKDGARLFPVMPGDRAGGNRHRLEYRKFCFSVRSSRFFYCKRDQTVEQVAQRDRGIHPWRHLNPTGHSPEHRL